MVTIPTGTIMDAEPKKLAALKNQFPWFKTPRILIQATEGSPDPYMELYFQYYPAPILKGGTEKAPDKTLSAIDTFLQSGEHRIVPSENATDEDVAVQGTILELDEEFLSEELAGIYLSQGLKAEAEEIYRRIGKRPDTDTEQ